MIEVEETWVGNQENDGAIGTPEARKEDASEGGGDLEKQRELPWSFWQLEKNLSGINPWIHAHRYTEMHCVYANVFFLCFSNSSKEKEAMVSSCFFTVWSSPEHLKGKFYKYLHRYFLSLWGHINNAPLCWKIFSCLIGNMSAIFF